MEGPKLEDFRKQPLITQDREGNSQDRIFKIRGHFVEKLSSHPWFIGVAPFGSRIKGYAEPLVIRDGYKESGSDSDFMVYYDSSKVPGREQDIVGLIEKAEHEVQDVTPDAEISTIRSDLNSPHEVVKDYLYEPRQAGDIRLSALCILADGPRVNEYRQKIGEQIMALQPAERTKVIDAIVEEIALSEKGRSDDIAERLDETQTDIERAIEERKPQWRKWITDRLFVDA